MLSPDLLVSPAESAATASAVSLLVTALLLGIRHGVDWDHIAAITDITSTTSAADAAEQIHQTEHAALPRHRHAHGGTEERLAHPTEEQSDARDGTAAAAVSSSGPQRVSRERYLYEQRRAVALGTLYALGHALVVVLLGFAALQFGTLLPDWVDPLMGRVVGVTLLVLGAWVFASLYQYARYGREFRLRSRWMALFDGIRYAWRWLSARLHGHEHVRPLEMSSYGPRTAFGVGMIHGIGAETGSQVLIIAAVGGAAGLGLGVPMMLAFVVGLLISNTAIVVLTSTGFVTSQLRTRLYLVVGVLAGIFSVIVGLAFLTETESILPNLDRILPAIGT